MTPWKSASSAPISMEHPPLVMLKPCSQGSELWCAFLHVTCGFPSCWVAQEWRHSSFQQRRLLLKILLQHIIDNQEAICRCVCKLGAGSLSPLQYPLGCFSSKGWIFIVRANFGIQLAGCCLAALHPWMGTAMPKQFAQRQATSGRAVGFEQSRASVERKSMTTGSATGLEANGSAHDSCGVWLSVCYKKSRTGAPGAGQRFSLPYAQRRLQQMVSPGTIWVSVSSWGAGP